jgi:hypothetical protein
MTVKIEIAKGEFKGNLKDSQQKYFINYLPQVITDDKIVYFDKIELALITPSNDGESSYHSLRFNDPAQLRLFLFDIIRAFAYFKKARMELTEFNSMYQANDIFKRSFETIKQVLKEE